MKSYRILLPIILSLTVLVAGGCASGKRKAAELTGDELTNITKTGFLDDYSNLQPGRSAWDPMFVWQNPNSFVYQYNKWILDPVEFWGRTGESEASLGDRQRLADKLYSSMVKSLSRRYEVVKEPGRDVMTVRLAIVNETADSPVLKVKSSSTPAVTEPPTGTPLLPRYITTQFLVKDSRTGDIIRKGIDRRFTAGDEDRPETWADVYATVDHYAGTVVYRFCLHNYDQDCGALKPPRVTPPSR